MTIVPQGRWPDSTRWYERELAHLLAERRAQLFHENRHQADSRHRNPFALAVVASRVGVTTPTVSYWENCATTPGTLDLWVKWADVLGLDFPELLMTVHSQAGRVAA